MAPGGNQTPAQTIASMYWNGVLMTGKQPLK